MISKESKKRNVNSDKNCRCTSGKNDWKIITNRILISIAFILIGLGIRQRLDLQQEIKQDDALHVFLKIDDIAHEQLNQITKEWNHHNFTWIEEFTRIDMWFHSAKTQKEKFKWALEMEDYIKKVDIWLHEIWGINTPEEMARDRKFHEVITLFDALK